MDDIWISIPNFKNQSTVDIKAYFTKLYEDKKESLYETYKDNIADKMLNDYTIHLTNMEKLYNVRFSYLFNTFKQDLEKGKNKYITKFILYGPDVHYTTEEEMILNKALNNFCYKLTDKNYPYSIKKKQKVIDDFMDGTCTIDYEVLEITLK